MSYILVLLLLIVNHNDASEDYSRHRKNFDDSFNINIGAGYAVGSNQLPNNTPNGSSNISFPKNFFSQNLKLEATPNPSFRAPRILTDFTPQVGDPIQEAPRNNEGLQNSISKSSYKEHYPAASRIIQNYNSPKFQSVSDGHSNTPNLIDFQKVLNEIEVKKPYNKVVQVIKVPAIYEIHLQSDHDINQNKINVNPTGDLFWKNYYGNKPNMTTKHFDDDKKWLNNYYMQREERFSKGGEKYYDFSDIPVVPHENYPEHQSDSNTFEENELLHPIITHHHHTSNHNVPLPDIEEDMKGNYYFEFSNKPVLQSKHHYNNKKPHYYPINNVKRHVGHNNYDTYNSNPTKSVKPQALHEVPAPLLGKYPHSKLLEFEKTNPTISGPKLLPTPNTYTKVIYSKLSPTTIKPVNTEFSHLSGIKDKETGPEVVPSNVHFTSYIKGNPDLIYGKNSKQVLSPYDMNIPVIPGSTTVTVTESQNNFGHNLKHSASSNSFIYQKPGIVANKFHSHHVGNTPQKTTVHVGHNFQYPVSNNDDTNVKPNAIETKPSYYEDIVSENNVDQKFQHTTIPSMSSAKPLTPDSKPNNLFHQVIDLPYQTQTSITEVVPLTTPSAGISFTKTNNFGTTTQRTDSVMYNHQPQQPKKKDSVNGNVNMNVASTLGLPTSQQFLAKQSTRRRTFSSNMDNNFTKNKFVRNGYKDFDHSRLSRRKGGPTLDYIIYITRKSVV